MFSKLIIGLVILSLGYSLKSQEMLRFDRNTLYMATMGNMSGFTCGDDDFSQTLFVAVAENKNIPFYIRVFDPDCGGEFDRPNGLWETNTIFEIFGGKDCLSAPDARSNQASGAYKSGVSLARELFAEESVVDGTWVSFGPFEPAQGEKLANFPGYTFFKIIVEGRTGNDGNLYSVFISQSSESNITLEYSELFHYELTYFNDKTLSMNTMRAEINPGNDLQLPIELAPIKRKTEFEILAEPIDE